MANLKNKVLQALQNGKNLETILNDLSKSQENLLKNHIINLKIIKTTYIKKSVLSN